MGANSNADLGAKAEVRAVTAARTLFSTSGLASCDPSRGGEATSGSTVTSTGGGSAPLRSRKTYLQNGGQPPTGSLHRERLKAYRCTVARIGTSRPSGLRTLACKRRALVDLAIPNDHGKRTYGCAQQNVLC